MQVTFGFLNLWKKKKKAMRLHFTHGNVPRWACDISEDSHAEAQSYARTHPARVALRPACVTQGSLNLWDAHSSCLWNVTGYFPILAFYSLGYHVAWYEIIVFKNMFQDTIILKEMWGIIFRTFLLKHFIQCILIFDHTFRSSPSPPRSSPPPCTTLFFLSFLKT